MKIAGKELINNSECKLYSVYANPEHMHFLASMSPVISEEKLATIVAESSVKFINENKLCKINFSWRQTCAAFSVSKADVDKVCKYILNQKEHHLKMTFTEEYEKFIKFYQRTLKT